MRLHIIIHERFESPAAIEKWAKNKNYDIQYTKMYQNETLPKHLNNFDFLIIMGGPQSPQTTSEECVYFNAQKEISFIREAIGHGKIVLGICLGSQLIGEALGAKYEQSPNREIGFFDITLTDEGKKDIIFSKFPETFLVGHWHGDMPGLTKESKVLAYSKGCPRQIIKYSPKVYGFQCHFEFNDNVIKDMMLNGLEELEKYQNLPYIQSPKALYNIQYSTINSLLYIFLNDIVKL